ncbi:MAG TPA: hypothetical protein VE645_19845 [Pseudonocardiaceae bacterium]|nr:hypothetical protein [Pseudonocardiaceae bacterium]
MTLHRILVHMIAETDWHAGHVDIVLSLIAISRGCPSWACLAQGVSGRWDGPRSRTCPH